MSTSTRSTRSAPVSVAPKTAATLKPNNRRRKTPEEKKMDFVLAGESLVPAPAAAGPSSPKRGRTSSPGPATPGGEEAAILMEDAPPLALNRQPATLGLAAGGDHEITPQDVAAFVNASDSTLIHTAPPAGIERTFSITGADAALSENTAAAAATLPLPLSAAPAVGEEEVEVVGGGAALPDDAPPAATLFAAADAAFAAKEVEEEVEVVGGGAADTSADAASAAKEEEVVGGAAAEVVVSTEVEEMIKATQAEILRLQTNILMAGNSTPIQTRTDKIMLGANVKALAGLTKKTGCSAAEVRRIRRAHAQMVLDAVEKSKAALEVETNEIAAKLEVALNAAGYVPPTAAEAAAATEAAKLASTKRREAAKVKAAAAAAAAATEVTDLGKRDRDGDDDNESDAKKVTPPPS